MNNFSGLDRLFMKFVGMVKYPSIFILSSLTFRKWSRVLLRAYRRQFPFSAVLKNGKQVIIHSQRELWLLLRSSSPYSIKYDESNGTSLITTTNGDKAITLYGSDDNAGGWGIFMTDTYRWLPVNGKTVIDIGANIGDSAIYFVLRGARQVIALEPFENNLNAAKKNIESNNFSDKIRLIHAGCASKAGQIIIGNDQCGSTSSQLVASNGEGVTIQLVTLEEILDAYNIDEKAILKMDCEGAEYDCILSASESTLKRFSHIQIEYHLGYKNLNEKLEQCGFKVSHTRPSYWKDKITDRELYMGYLYASS